jgi:recombination protein RecT
MNQVTVQQPQSVTDVVNFQQQHFQQVVTGSDVEWAKESQFAIQALQKNEYLAKVAWGNQASLQNAIINVAAVEISLNPALKHAYLVPRDGMVCLDISYMGLLHLAMADGAIVWGQSKLVYSNDTYTNNGIDKAPTHKQNTFGDKGDIVGCYCTVKLKSGDYITEEMDIEALSKVKGTSKSLQGKGAKYSPWNTFPEEMMRKTVVKRASKYWPSCERLRTAVDVINEHEGLETEHQKDEALNDKRSQDVDKLNNMLESGDYFNFFPFLQTREETTQARFYASFAKGEVTSSKEKARNLQNTGIEEWKSIVSDVKKHLKNEDKQSILNIVQDFEPYHKIHLVEMMGKKGQELTIFLNTKEA